MEVVRFLLRLFVIIFHFYWVLSFSLLVFNYRLRISIIRSLRLLNLEVYDENTDGYFVDFGAEVVLKFLTF